MKKFVFLFVIISIFLFIQCAYFINTKFQEMSISSNPTNATIFVNGKDVGKTPVVYPLRRNVDTLVKIELEGYQPYEIILSKKISGWCWVDILIWFPEGIVIDLLAGTVYKFEPKSIDTNLSKNRDILYIKAECNVDENLQKIGQLIKK